MQKTLILIKPDAVARGLIGEVISRLERRAFKIEALELRYADKDLLEEHYRDLVDQPFFPGILDYMSSGPLVAMVVSGVEVISSFRLMAGATMPAQASSGTIRGDLAQNPGQGAVQNIVHGSDSEENAIREIKLWFPQHKI